MATLAEIRQKYPQYSDMSDTALADAMHSKFYADMPRAEFDAKLGIGPQRSTGAQVARGAGIFAKGFNDSVAETLGAIPDTLNRGARAIGIPIPGENGGVTTAIKGGMQWANDKLAGLTNPALAAAGVDLGKAVPENATERFAYGAGHGVADAASVALPAAGVARAAKAGTVTQGVANALAAQPVTQAISGAVGGGVGEATDNPLLGFAASIAAPAGVAAVRRLASPVAMSLTPEETRRAALATKAGIELTPGQATGSRPLQAIESSLTQLPFSASGQNKIYDAQRTAFNRAALSKAGVSGERVSPDVIDAAFRAAGQKFDDLASRTTLNFDPKFTQDITAVAQNYGRRLPTDVAPVFQSYMDDLAPLIQATASNQKPQIDGRTFQNISSNLAAAARNAKSRPELQQALSGLRDALDGVMDRSAQIGANPNVPRLQGAGGQASNLADEWRQARREYRNLLSIDEAAGAGTQADRAAGNLSFGAIRSAVDKQDPRGFARGRGDMAEIAQIADFLAQKIPNSGTAERSAAMRLLQGGSIFGGAGGTAAIGGADPIAAALTGAATVALPPVIQRAMNSPAGRAYLMNQRFSGVGPQMNKALAAALMGADLKGELLSAP